VSIFWIAVICGALVAVAYLALGVRAFMLVRRDVLAAAARGIPDDIGELPDEAHRGFVWKALGGVCASTLVIVLLGVNSVFWYLPIILAIGSAMAVIVAFLVDSRPTASAANR
jgi:hypothetical protein